MYNNNLWVMEQKPHVQNKEKYIIMEKKKITCDKNIKKFYCVMQLKLTKPNNVANWLH